uniref:probable pancreatic secretory proteinase inhibitor isoform X1 n=1 Tax=Scatophagus argus TaxID=75038 RepID=UPI001ED85C39|nr:probable pancreatic secretory proteinase inhibitor isoform X1 [Scatophagus argus]
MLIPRLKPGQKRAAAVTTTESLIVSDDNTEPASYMTTAGQHQTSQPRRTCTQTHQQPIGQKKITHFQPPLRQLEKFCLLVSFHIPLRFHPGCFAELSCSSVLLFLSVQMLRINPGSTGGDQVVFEVDVLKTGKTGQCNALSGYDMGQTVTARRLAQSISITCLMGFSQHAVPSCVGMSVTQACPLNYSPVCGSDGVTYPNECSLCVQRLEKNADILIVSEGPC